MQNIDWAATGSMIGGIGTWIAVFAASFAAWKLYILTNNIAKQQLTQVDRQISIELFDKRYIIYKTFISYFSNDVIYKSFEKVGNLDRKSNDWIFQRAILFGCLEDFQEYEKFINEVVKLFGNEELRVDEFLKSVSKFKKDKQIVRESKLFYQDNISDSLIEWMH